MKNAIFILLLVLCVVYSITAQSLSGTKWKTIDDKTGKTRSVVEFYEKGNKIYGKIIQGFDANIETATCTACKDDRKGQKIIGLEVVRGLQKVGKKWEEGHILDPDDGKVYECKIWIEHGKLKVRGYIAFFYRTQTWEKVE